MTLSEDARRSRGRWPEWADTGSTEFDLGQGHPGLPERWWAQQRASEEIWRAHGL